MISKHEAGYTDHPVGGRRCDACTMYRADNRCTLVSGRILPDGHCRYWEPKKVVKLFVDIIKSEPSVGDVHVTTALGNQLSRRRRRYMPFSAFVSGGPKKPSDGPSTFGPVPVITATEKQTPRPDVRFRPNPVVPPVLQNHPRRQSMPEGPAPRYRRFTDTIRGAAAPSMAPTLKRKPRSFAEMITGKPIKQRGFLDIVSSPNATTKRYSSAADLPDAVRTRFAGKSKKLRQFMHVWNGSYARHGSESRAFAEAWSTVQKAVISAPIIEGLKNRFLTPFDEDTYHVPFRAQPASLGGLRPDQVPRFLDAITHPKRHDLATVPLAGLMATTDRVQRKSVEKHLKKLSDRKRPKPPVIVRLAGMNHIADGHNRLTAAWLNGDDHMLARYTDLDPFSEEKPDPSVEHRGSRYDLLQPGNGRRLSWNSNGTLAVPFTYDPAFLAGLRPGQAHRFLWTLTHQKKLPVGDVRLTDLRAIQDRVNPDTVAAHIEDPSAKPPVVVRVNGGQYIADGHDRLAARWLSGDENARVRLYDLGELPSSVSKTWSTSFRIEKADPDKQQLFGWASVVTKDGRAVVDKQEDIIPVDELENAAYEYVLECRDQGDMHVRTIGVGKLIESMMFTAEKQKALGIDLGMEGWWVGFQCQCKELWKDVKEGRKLEFSIGGAAVSEKVAAYA